MLVALAVALVACSPRSRRAGRPTTTSEGPATTTTTAPPPTTTTTAPPAVSPAPAVAAAPPCPAIPPRAAPRADRSRYRLSLSIDLPGNAVDGTETVEFTPDLPVDRLVFRLWANAPRPAAGGAIESVTEVSIAGQGQPAQPDATTYVVPIPGGSAAGHTIEATVKFRLVLPRSIDDRISRSGDSVRLGSFFPILPWEPGVGWATDPPVSGFAEASTAAAADFDVDITAPGLDVLATGVRNAAGHWMASAVPDFALSAGHFATASSVVGAPQPVAVTVGVAAGIAESPKAYLDRITAALADYGSRFGAYPWPAYSMVVEPGLKGGIEYPMHVMQGPGSIGRTTPHEAGHMWFYALVENDQGRDPWLDEGLASWAEATHEGVLPSFVGRVIPAGGAGQLGQPMTYWESRQSIYYASVYVQGVQALAAIGRPAVVDCILRLYVARHAFHVARPADLVAAAEAVVPGAAATLARYGVRP